jgi:tryptophan synthase alpha chain
MSSLTATFKNLSERGEKALITYVMAGDPSLSQTEEIVRALDSAGADIVELGVPFSDPVADGPTIQRAAERALQQGTTLTQVLEWVAILRRRTRLPLVLMSYCNPIHAFGIERFFKTAHAVGVSGLIIPDLPIEEAQPFLIQQRRHHVDLIFLVAPTTPPDRAARICGQSSGFVYYVSLTGVTGARLQDQGDATARIRTLKAMSDSPVAVGFGIATPQEAKAVAAEADGVIVGSALVKIIGTAASDPEYLSRLTAFVSSLKGALR